MGRKVHPIGFRLNINKPWMGRWYAEGQDYIDYLHQDFAIRENIMEYSDRAGVSQIEIERFPSVVKIVVHTAKPGIMIGRKGETIKSVRRELQSMTGKKIDLEIEEIKNECPLCGGEITSVMEDIKEIQEYVNTLNERNAYKKDIINIKIPRIEMVIIRKPQTSCVIILARRNEVIKEKM